MVLIGMLVFAWISIADFGVFMICSKIDLQYLSDKISSRLSCCCDSSILKTCCNVCMSEVCLKLNIMTRYTLSYNYFIENIHRLDVKYYFVVAGVICYEVRSP